jgi:L-alanine-DL-glutamate epimerase-like enolase superfamily enzyme
MPRVIVHAVNIAAGVEGDSAFAIWRQLWDAQSYWGLGEELPPLLVHFGTSLVERALIEACCRAAGLPFWRMLRHNRLGIRLGALHPVLKTQEPADFLPATPLSKATARHTVGLADPLEESDIAPAGRLDDGLPQSLAACIQAYGLRHFKIKVNGHIDRDLERLTRVAGLIQRHAPPDFAFSLDGNEQFRSVNDFMVFWNEVTHAAALRSLFKHLLFVEQPFHRDIALAAAAMRRLTEWPERPPLIIDESDGELYSLSQALRLGYAGTSHKNCKGIFKGIANACLLAQRRIEHPELPTILSGEDLANIGPVALLQDLAVCAALGIHSIERNGHHYFAGLSMFPADVQRATLAAHGDLYRPSRDGWPTLRIEDGALNLASANEAPLGVGFALDVEKFAPLNA